MSTDVDPGKPVVLVSGDFLLESIKLEVTGSWVREQESRASKS